MSRSVVIELEMPGDLKQFRLPKGVNRRLQDLLDKQCQQGKLSRAERQEAEGLVNLAEMLSLLRLRGKGSPMSHVPAPLRRLVIRRAANRCEYCLLSQAGQEATFHIDHILPESQGGETTEENLALACVSCSLRKEARQSGVDSETGKRVRLFHPRRDDWAEHFRWDGLDIEGTTPTGRATVQTLKLNRPSILLIRGEETLHGRFPP